MYYKIVHENRVIDVLDRLIFLKYQPKHDIMILCDESDAQAFLSSDGNTIWHEPTMYPVPKGGFDTVSVIEIDKYEYEQLKMLNCKTPQEIIDTYTLSLIQEGVI